MRGQLSLPCRSALSPRSRTLCSALHRTRRGPEGEKGRGGAEWSTQSSLAQRHRNVEGRAEAIPGDVALRWHRGNAIAQHPHTLSNMSDNNQAEH